MERGDWESYFSLLKQAVTKTKCGNVELEFPSRSDVELRVSYPISEEAKLSGVFEFEESAVAGAARSKRI